MAKIFKSPSKYIQGSNILKTHLDEIEIYGNSPLIVTDPFVWDMLGKELCANLKKDGLVPVLAEFEGETSVEQINKIQETNKRVDFVIALGGGKAIDTGKAVANDLRLPVVVIPTAASTDAPTSAISVTYDAEGFFQAYHYYNKNPELVFVDTEVLVKAPVRMLKSGIADGLATFVEVEAVANSYGQTLAGGTQTIAAYAIAKACEETLFANARQAVISNEIQAVTPAFEAVVEANTLLSGLGFESGGLAAAHALQNSFSSIEGPIQRMTHGEKVAFTTIVQLVLQGDSKERIHSFVELYQTLGLPTTLKELGLEEVSDQTLLSICERTVEGEDTLKQMPMSITAQSLLAAIKVADALVKNER
ncbi:glycerol dehydrogenase [Enterococcus sp. AZ194]|uniref:glycerol dehydrogenase n=1 Tax=Enterococcus sp. AZ194 TaxID=2774629 RepID=UPI003F229C21